MKYVIIAVYLCAASIPASAGTGLNATWQRCGVDQKQTPQRVFANPDGKVGWQEYRTLKEIPELSNDAGEYAGLLTGRDGDSLIITEWPGEDFDAFTDYCFDKNGHLLQMRFELRTAWGWGFREEGPIVKGKISSASSEFFDTKTEKVIPKPGENADEVLGAVKPDLYTRKSQLPFFALLS
jgi:hypothetical protein